MTTHADHDRFLALLGEHKKILYKVAYTYCRQAEDRRDLVQDMIVQLWKSFASFDPERVRFSTWMYTVAMNVAISFYRGEERRIRADLPLEDYGIDIAGADQVFDEAGDNLRVLHQLIGELDEMSRALILLFLDGFSHEEIARTLGITPSNVATRIGRLKQKLQERFTASTQGATA